MGCTASYACSDIKCVSIKTYSPVISNQDRETAGIVSEEEKTILKRQWKVLSSDIKRHGTDVFLQLFKLNPEMKQLFPFRNIDDNELINNVQFRSHGIRFMQTIGAVVENIENLDMSMTEPLVTLGKQHTQFKNFNVMYFEAFYGAISAVWRNVLGVSYTPSCADAWSHVLVFIMNNLKQGHHLASLEMEAKHNYQNNTGSR